MNELILFKGLFDNDLNIPQLDHEPCKRCGKVPEIKEYMARTLKGTLIRRIDRTTRIDCDASVGSEPPKLETFHKACWVEEVFND